MQTFLPYPDFAQSASVLDDKRLGKQRVECLQILQTLAKGPTEVIQREARDGQIVAIHRKAPWYNHPAVRMWRGHHVALASYGMSICDEWLRRGFSDTCKTKIEAFLWVDGVGNDPAFIGNPDFHASHRSNLLRKDPTHYSHFGWTEPNNLPYIWPV